MTEAIQENHHQDQGTDSAEEETEIKIWKVKKLIQKLDSVHGAGTSMISLIIPARDQVARYNKMLTDEYGTASHIKSRVNRLSVLGAITSTKEKLKLYSRVPPNGLVVYCGEVDDGKKLTIAFEPHKPINTSLYLCDNKFHTEMLKELLESDIKYGFVVVDGSGTLYGTLSGNTRTVLHKFSVELPKKHGRGGQSSVRFARLRLEKRHNYLRKVAEGCVQHFLNPADSLPNVSGLILGGLADFKNDLYGSDMFDQRLKRIVVDVVDTSYGFENGFNQAIELTAERLKDVKFIKEKKLISSFFDQIAQDSGRYCFGIRDSLYSCEAGAVETLIVWESLETERFVLNTPEGPKILYLNPEEAQKQENFKDPKTGQDYETAERTQLVEWLAENYKKFGCTLQFVTDRSQEGAQFVKGFGGIGALLRYKLDFNTLDEEEARENNEDEYDFFY